MKPKAQKFYEIIFVVEGFGDFPLDMLRYDSAFPATERDSYIAANHRENRRVALVSRRSNDNAPSAERWRSFCWTVLATFSERADAEAYRDEAAPPRAVAGP